MILLLITMWLNSYMFSQYAALSGKSAVYWETLTHSGKARDTSVVYTLAKTGFLSNLLYVNPNRKHHHIIDFETLGILEMNAGALGYNYLYSLNRRVKMGGRFGMWYFKSPQDISPIYARWRLSGSLYALVNITIWKSLQAELGAGYESFQYGPEKTNTMFRKSGFDTGSLGLRTALNVTLINHIFLRGGMLLHYDIHAEIWGRLTTLSIGYKF